MKKPGIYSLTILITVLVIFFTNIHSRYPDNNTPSDEVINDLTTEYPMPDKGCLASGCHNGLEPIREHHSDMAQAIYKRGLELGDPNGCTVCHKGDIKEEKNKNIAHLGLIRYPASMWVNDKTCGMCHDDHVYMLHRSLMETEAGKIQGALWGWGAQTGYDPVYGNYAVEDTDGPVPRVGTDVYKRYIQGLMAKHPGNFPVKLDQLPEVDLSTLNEHPEQAVFTYLRSDCQRCHFGVKGAQRRGDYRGIGCSACHIPYSDMGLYEGNDNSIPKDEPGHLLVHSIQSSRKTKVKVNGEEYSGIPSETCSTCHNRGKRIGVSFLGIIESPYDTPWNDDGTGQYKLHGKRYLSIRDDHHHDPESREGNPKGGLLCQDCHTTTAMHGNGNIGGTTLGEVEVECSDCHGTPEKYPWELPIGFNDELGMELPDAPRGIAKELLKITKKFSTVYPAMDGYVLTTRGNPFGNVVREQNKVIVHSATGLDFEAPVLKTLNKKNKWQNPEKAHAAMVRIKDHVQNMECYSCHSTWAPQCYGCHIKVDYSQKRMSTDWIKTGSAHYYDGETIETKDGYLMKQPGKASEGRTYIRWEDPVLGINGEGRVSPIIPGCQQITTVINEDGEVLVSNKIWRTPPWMENGGEEGQRGIDMTPAQPHTVTREARDCVSCHANPKTLGYGINDGKYLHGYDEDVYVDLRFADGRVISRNATPQFSSIPDLPMDLSQVVTRDGKQLQTVGHHWPLSGPLTQHQREKMERVGICIACHQDIPDGNLFIEMITTAGDKLNMTPHFDEEHAKLINNDIKLAAVIKIITPPLLFLIGLLVFFYLRKKRKIIKA